MFTQQVLFWFVALAAGVALAMIVSDEDPTAAGPQRGAQAPAELPEMAATPPFGMPGDRAAALKDPCLRGLGAGQAIPAGYEPTEHDLCPVIGPFAGREIGQTIFDWQPDLSERDLPPAADIHRHNVMIVLDVSGSMRDWRIKEAKQAVRFLIRNAPPETNLGLILFGLREWRNRLLPRREIQTRVMVALGTGNRDQLAQVIDEVEASGGTPTSVAVERAADAMRIQFYRQLRFGQYDIILVTDGQPNEGYEPDDAIEQLHRTSPATIHAVAFSRHIAHLKRLQSRQLLRYYLANDEAQLKAVFAQILAEH